NKVGRRRFAVSQLAVRRRESLVRRDRGDHFGAFAQAEKLADGLTVAGACRHLVYAHRVGHAVVAEQDDLVQRAPGNDGDDGVPFADARRIDRGQAADALDPAVARQHHVGVFLDNVGLRVELRRVLFRRYFGAAAVAIFFADLLEFL